MHLMTCQHPKVIYNRSLRQYVAVPCRKCDFCKSIYRYVWQLRLQEECKRHAQVVFFTLTYNNDNLPMMQYNACIHRHLSRTRKVTYFVGKNMVEVNKFINDLYVIKYPPYTADFGYLRKKDIQDFVKRLRRLIEYHYGYTKIQYFVAGEYGPKTLRPHYHGLLFFDSSKVAKEICGIIHKAWSFGFVDAQFAQGEASDYVSKYVFGISDLPEILQHPYFKPFFLCSRKPIIGSAIFTEQTQKAIVFNSRCEVSVLDSKRRQFIDVQIPRSLENRLFPKCKGYSKIADFDRALFYEQALLWFTAKRERYDYKAFEEWCFTKTTKVVDVYLADSFEDYVFPQFYSYYVHDNGRLRVYDVECETFNMFGRMLYDLGYFQKDVNGSYPALMQLYIAAKNICYYCTIFKLSLRFYVHSIFKYYKNKTADKLKDYFVWQNDFIKHDDKSLLINVDQVFKKRVLENNYWLCEDGDHIMLESFGLDSESLNLYQGMPSPDVLSSLEPTNTYDYKSQVSLVTEMINRSNKTKKKNDSIYAL